MSEAAHAKEVPASVVHETAADGLVEGGHHRPAPDPLKSGDKPTPARDRGRPVTSWSISFFIANKWLKFWQSRSMNLLRQA